MKYLFLSLLLTISGCAVMPDKLLVSVDHTSHILQHFEHEGLNGGTEGCTGPMLGIRWEWTHAYIQASDAYCAIGTNDYQKEVANLQAGMEINLK